MRRTLALVGSGLVLLGFVAALVPAQETAPWRRSSPTIPGATPRSDRSRVYRDNRVTPVGGELAAEALPPSEPAQFPMEAAQNLHAAPGSDGTSDDQVRQAQLRRRAYQERNRGADGSSPARSQGDVSQHSVLKRNSETPLDAGDTADAPPPTVPTQSPADDAGVLAAPPGATSSRRMGRTASTSRTGSERTATADVSEVQVVSRMPALRMELVGPGSIQVGNAAKFTIYANNDGDVAAEDVVVRLPLPGTVNLTKGESTVGEAEVQAGEDGAASLVWAIAKLAPRGHETLQIHLVPSDGQGFDLDLAWTCRPPSAAAHVTVKQPQLAMTLAGPGDMLLGDEKTFTLTVSNPGTGDATGVKISLSSGGGKPQVVEVGTVPAGQQAEIPVQVAADRPGNLEIKAVASGDSDLSADAAANVLVRSAELGIAVSGPQLKFAGSDATYVVVVTNRGNAPADAAAVTVVLPEQAKYLGGVDGAASGKGSVKWAIGSLPPGGEKSYEVNCELLAEGPNRVLAQIEAKHADAAQGEAITNVEAVADLKLAVNDPAGPSAVGEEVVYEVQIMNRGTRAATQVKVLTQFGAGIEPTGVVGGKGKIVPGQVVFEPLPSLEAGEQVTVKVKAKADKAGTHQFRVEVTTGEDGTRLVSEGTSRFFDERASTPADSARTAAKPQLPTPAKKR